jgi:hypothetical protein
VTALAALLLFAALLFVTTVVLFRATLLCVLTWLNALSALHLISLVGILLAGLSLLMTVLVATLLLVL